MMIGYRRSFVFVAAIQAVFGQNSNDIPREPKDLGLYHPYQEMMPRYCWRPPRGIDIHKCCPRPNLYSDEVMDLCRIEKPAEKGSQVPAKPKGPKPAPCQHGLCLMKNSNLLMANSSIDYEKLGIYIYKWAAANPEFTDAILIAKPLCAKERDESWNMSHAPKLCDPDRIFVCLQAQILWNCKVQPFEECQRLREHMDMCRPYYRDPRENNEKTK